jgi:hypothetical protein
MRRLACACARLRWTLTLALRACSTMVSQLIFHERIETTVHKARPARLAHAPHRKP